MTQFFNQTTSKPDRHMLQQPIFLLLLAHKVNITIMQKWAAQNQWLTLATQFDQSKEV